MVAEITFKCKSQQDILTVNFMDTNSVNLHVVESNSNFFLISNKDYDYFRALSKKYSGEYIIAEGYRLLGDAAMGTNSHTAPP